ncbi:hypothetical protein TraAM80_00359 [Trypanosoma rangeli]|uniref:Uncharacterized protein n=1 Tax=Trypanosoma rangeli TaxID=5698 RepID=A0A3R7RT34_TRYRA|nr:uncharacterized protein TraAM80_00359 [Trypanosoma rangeli]RNF12348.1 hypothetical protein TraAM80_00359 [Trypanosoma rangeli]|eukprot:RNF12348.1 hypothetical protein TraAM80_00359 [Trypanosoma rangeli]
MCSAPPHQWRWQTPSEHFKRGQSEAHCDAIFTPPTHWRTYVNVALRCQNTQQQLLPKFGCTVAAVAVAHVITVPVRMAVAAPLLRCSIKPPSCNLITYSCSVVKACDRHACTTVSVT